LLKNLPDILKWRLVAAFVFSALAATSDPLWSDLRDIVEASGSGISWQDFDRMSGAERMNAAVRIGSALARVRPRESWRLVRDLPSGDDREFLMRGILLERADRDPAAGLRDLLELPAGSERTGLTRVFFGRWAAGTPAKAADAVPTLPVGGMRDAATVSLLVAWAASDGPAAARWASHLPSTEAGPVKRLDIFAMAGQENLMGVHYDRGQAMQLAAFEWAKRDRRAALQWAQSVADPALGALLIKLVTREP
jgi:hypothetical protein